jgi:hypothetical protein
VGYSFIFVIFFSPPSPMRVGGGGGKVVCRNSEDWQPRGEVRREVFHGGWTFQSRGENRLRTETHL